jgi:hypothetical protein
MRKVKFRGFSVQHNKFVYGDLITQGEHVWITEENGSDLIADENTVGEFIGLYDVNGSEIYEGDFVKSQGSEWIYAIVFDTGAFKLSRPDGIQFTIEKEDVLEIVGNIHTKQTVSQPEWCTYPDAAMPVFGCWSLLNGRVTGEDFCKSCELYKEHTAQDEK